MSFPAAIHIKEEGPREGFQIEGAGIATADKVRLINALSDTGLRRIQVVSFVNPRRVPGMADAEEVVRTISRRAGVRYEALWLNVQGLERALACEGLDVQGRISLCASEPFLLRNQNCTQSAHVRSQHEAMRRYRACGIDVTQISIMAAFGCNYAGDIEVRQVLDTVRAGLSIASEHGFTVHRLALADTMAWATPLAIRQVVGSVQDGYPGLEITLHLHDTRGMAVACAWSGLEMGVASFDTSVGGLGGCPFAGHKGAAGNLCTEELVFLCDEIGIRTGVDLESLCEVARLAESIVGHPLPGAVMRGGSLRRLRENIALARRA